ncbi:amidohydrolase family protein [Kaistia nematophila]|uniref:Amidohydrolase family protein n=1 Tax=Kaistia nematophila TaxID=2994654 RepID=A0A9X3IP83_9HYPH|nr:amidohydrolase family protein [Kaistia nematophila]MCX5571700.1 amidohydrolase family protein [Kaistia nematophila]
MTGQRYSGAIIDAHHHFWDLSLGKHGWLEGGQPDDELAPLRRNHLARDYEALALPEGIVASVHVEANWDPADPAGENRWLDTLERSPGIASRYVAHAALLDPGAAAVLEQHAESARVVGIREILSWHPDPAKRRMPDNDRMDDPRWRASLARFRDLGFSFDLLITPHQFESTMRLVADFPDIAFILNHCASPIDRDADDMRRWREGLVQLAIAPNVAIKISDPVAYDPQWSRESLTEVIHACIDAFGPERSMFATDYPVAGLHIGFAEWIDVFKDATRGFSADEQAALFAGTARRWYRMA